MGTSKMAGAESGAEIRDKVGAGAENIRFRDTAVLCLQVGSRSWSGSELANIVPVLNSFGQLSKPFF